MVLKPWSAEYDIEDVSVIKEGFSDREASAPGSTFILLWRRQWALKNLHLEFASTVPKMTTGQKPAITSTVEENRAEEMAQSLKAFSALPKVMISIPSNHMVAHNYL